MDCVMTLRGLAVSKFGSIKGFADAIGWCYSKANRVVNGRQEPDAVDIREMARVLEINDSKMIASIFLS